MQASLLCPRVLFTQLDGSLHRPQISVGHFEMISAVEKATTPTQIASQRTPLATHTCL